MRVYLMVVSVSTPLPSNEGRDILTRVRNIFQSAVSTPLPSNEGRDY